MHIAFFTDQHPATLGGQQVSLGLQRVFLELAGHQVSLITPPPGRAAPTHLDASGRAPRPDDVTLPAIAAGEYAFSVAGAAADRAIDRGLAGRAPVDVVHVQADFWGAWGGYRFAARHRTPLVHTVHTNVETGLPAVMPVPRLVLRLMYAAHRHHLRCGPVRDVAGYVRAFDRLADAMIVPSSHFADRLVGYGLPRRPHVIPTGVDDRTITALLAQPQRPGPRPRLVWPGRISREKRLDELIEALATSGADAELAVYGSGTDLARCRSSAAAHGVAQQVRFHGAVSHDTVLAALRDADAVVQTSLDYETQGLTVFEAIALGTPALVRDPNIVRDLPPEWCYPVADRSIDALAAAIGAVVAAHPSPRPGEPPTALRQSELTARLVSLYREVLDRPARPQAARDTRWGRRSSRV